jgi:thioredoxin 1
MKIINQEEQFYEAIIKSHIVMVDFFADWCGPCKKLNPILEELSKEIPNLSIVKIDVDNDKLEGLINLHKITSMPTIVFYKNQQLQSSYITGYQTKEYIIKFIEKYLK